MLSLKVLTPEKYPAKNTFYCEKFNNLKTEEYKKMNKRG